MTPEQAAEATKGINTVILALANAIKTDALRDVYAGHKMFGTVTFLASMIRCNVDEKEWPVAVDAFTSLLKYVLSSDMERQPDGSFILKTPLKQ
jgi:hypothetical protein